jgi:hypothetical protein
MNLYPLNDNDSDDMSYLSENKSKDKIVKENYIDNEFSISNNSDITDLEEPLLDAYEYIIDKNTGIRLYNGILLETKESIINNIKLYSLLNSELIFEPISSSTLTAKGLLNNIDFQHESIISKMTLPKDHNIIKIGCNEEEIYIFPNNYVDYNISHLVDIVKNSKNKKFKTRIECNCQNLLNYTDFILELYNKIKNQINLIKSVDIIKKIERYIIIQKNKNKILFEKIIKILKKLMNYIFHPYLYDDENILTIKELLNILQHNPDFERNENIKILQLLFEDVEKLVLFFKEYIRKCKCIKQPYDYNNKIIIKPVSEDIKKILDIKSRSRIQKYSRRKILGCGKYFSSQITFEIFGSSSQKIYKIKIFRNGNFQAPGIKNKEMLDIIDPLISLINYLKEQFETDINIAYIISVMRNYLSNVITKPFISKLKDHNGKDKIIGTHIFLDRLDIKCRQEKNSNYITPNEALQIYNILSKIFNNKIACIIYDFCNFTTIKIAGITNNSEKSGGLLLKFDRPIPEKPNKKMTVKITSTGKINFDGCNSEIEVQELYYWLHNIFRRHYNEIIFNPENINYYISDDDEYDSLYDN